MSGKKYADALKGFDRDQFYTPTEALGIVKNTVQGRVRPERRRVGPPRGRSPQGRPDGARHRGPAVGHGQGRARRRLRRRRSRRRGPRGRRRHRRRRRPRGPDRGRQVRLRRGHRDARHDAARRSPRPGPRSPWPDAEPEDRHRDPGRRPRRVRVQGRQGRVPHRPLRQRPRPAGQGQLRARRRWSRTSAPCSTSCSGPSRRAPRGATCARSRCRRRWAPASTSTPVACAPTPSDRAVAALPYHRRRECASGANLPRGDGEVRLRRVPAHADAADRWWL